MPRTLSAAREAYKHEGAAHGRIKPSVNTLIIITIVVAFLWTSGSDAYAQLKEAQEVKSKESKLCLAEYTGAGCDALKLTSSCSDLLSCIQQKDTGVWSWLTLFCQFYLKEASQDYQLTAVGIGFLMLVRLIEAVTKTSSQ